METNEIMYQKSYQEYKTELDGELQRTAEGFVRIGYLLKVARDTNILAESGYKSVTEFAEAEYNLNKTQVSRFISINDKFSEGGYSDHLLPEYKGFGYAKLTLMLQLPDAVNEGLTTAYSKAEIQAIKDEVDAESKVSDIEVILEPARETVKEKLEQSTIGKTIVKLGEDEPELFVGIAKILSRENCSIETFKNEMAPQGEKTYSVRIPGTGRMMLMLTEQECRIVNIRSGEKESVTWDDIQEAWMQLVNAEADPKEGWSKLYCKPYPEKEEVAPVQQESGSIPKTVPKKESKVTKAKETIKKLVNKSTKEDHNADATEMVAEERVSETEKTIPEEHIDSAGIEKEEHEEPADQPVAAEPIKLTENDVEELPKENASVWENMAYRDFQELQGDMESKNWKLAFITARKLVSHLELLSKEEYA